MLSALSGGPVLVAVSGGSDSVALLHWMVDTFPKADLHSVTVDHGLRPEASDEAEMVANLAAQLGLPHKTLTWKPPGSATSADARQARYRLMHQLAQDKGSKLIVLGHNLDDQAETIFMRALRCRADSDTRGFSGIPEWASYRGIRLWRPLLGRSRQDLRQDLTRRSVGWIEDPSNQDLNYERVRVRGRLNSPNGAARLPKKQDLARLAGLAGRTRTWLNRLVADCITSRAIRRSDSVFEFTIDESLPQVIAREALSSLVLVAGGQSFRQPTAKLTDIVEAARAQTQLHATLGRCLIRTNRGRITIERESRNLPEFPIKTDEETIFDGRWLVKPGPLNRAPEISPYIEALETFRPSFDDTLHAALADLLDSPPRST